MQKNTTLLSAAVTSCMIFFGIVCYLRRKQIKANAALALQKMKENFLIQDCLLESDILDVSDREMII